VDGVHTDGGGLRQKQTKVEGGFNGTYVDVHICNSLPTSNSVTSGCLHLISQY